MGVINDKMVSLSGGDVCASTYALDAAVQTCVLINFRVIAEIDILPA